MKRLIATLLFLATLLIGLAGHPVYAQDDSKCDFALVESNCN